MRSSSVYKDKEQHSQLRWAWANYVDLTGMDFEKAWRHFLLDCGILLAGAEGQVNETILEFFAEIYVQNNPGFLTASKFVYEILIFTLPTTIVYYKPLKKI